MTEPAVVLTGMGIAEATGRADLVALARDRDDTSVAFLQVGEPSLSLELTRLADSGVDRIVLVGADFGETPTARSWLRRVAAYWLRARNGSAPELILAAGVLRRPDGRQLDALIAPARAGSGGRVSGAEAALSSPAWEDVPAYKHQVFLCRGPRCTAKGADATARALVLALMTQGLGDDDVLLTQTGCQFPCNHSPVVTVHPDDVWYGHVDPDVAAAIVTRHLVAGVPVESHRLPRRSP